LNKIATDCDFLTVVFGDPLALGDASTLLGAALLFSEVFLIVRTVLRVARVVADALANAVATSV
jgi:hypothetical protein